MKSRKYALGIGCEEIVAGVLEADLEGMGGFQVGRSCDSEVGCRGRKAI